MIMQINGASSLGFSSARLAGADKTKTGSDSIMLNKQEQNTEDSKVKNLQSQINAIREKIQEIGENEEMDEKTKAELRQSFQEQMTALEQQLSQRRMEARKEKLEEEQEKNPTQTDTSSRTDSSSSRRKYDSFEKDDYLNAAVSAFNSVDIAKIHQSAKKAKEGKADILEREAESDTRLIPKIGVIGHETKLYGMTLDNGSEDGDNPGVSYRGPVDYNQLEAWDEQGIPYMVTEYTSAVIGEQWSSETGEAVDAKLEEMTELRGDALQLTEGDAKALGEANRKVNGEENEKKSATQKAKDVFGKAVVDN